MVKKLNYEDFVHKLDGFYSSSVDKYSVYLTFKRVYEERFKHKNNKVWRKKRLEDRINQDKQNERFSVLVRAKLRKNRIQTILKEDEIDKFHHILMNVMTLYFIRQDNKNDMKSKKAPIKKQSKTQKRKLKRLRKIKQNPTGAATVKVDSTDKKVELAKQK